MPSLSVPPLFLSKYLPIYLARTHVSLLFLSLTHVSPIFLFSHSLSLPTLQLTLFIFLRSFLSLSLLLPHPLFIFLIPSPLFSFSLHLPLIPSLSLRLRVPERVAYLRELLDSDPSRLKEVFLESLKLESLRFALVDEIELNRGRRGSAITGRGKLNYRTSASES